VHHQDARRVAADRPVDLLDDLDLQVCDVVDRGDRILVALPQCERRVDDHCGTGRKHGFDLVGVAADRQHDLRCAVEIVEVTQDLVALDDQVHRRCVRGCVDNLYRYHYHRLRQVVVIVVACCDEQRACEDYRTSQDFHINLPSSRVARRRGAVWTGRRVTGFRRGFRLFRDVSFAARRRGRLGCKIPA